MKILFIFFYFFGGGGLGPLKRCWKCCCSCSWRYLMRPLSLIWRRSRFNQWTATTFQVTNYKRAAPPTSNCACATLSRSARRPQQHHEQPEPRRRRAVCLSLWWKTFRKASRCRADTAQRSVSRSAAQNKTESEPQMKRKSRVVSRERISQWIPIRRSLIWPGNQRSCVLRPRPPSLRRVSDQQQALPLHRQMREK